jgi:hypothetical protein
MEMAVSRKKTGSGGWLLFWLAFIIGITLLFMLNLERIKTTLQETKVLDHLTGSRAGETAEEGEGAVDEPPAVVEAPPERPAPTANDVRPDTGRPPAENAARAGGTSVSQVKTVARSVYLMKVDSNGTILWTKVNRNLPASESPLQDALEALMKGPSADEEKQGLISLIPKNVKLLNITVRGSTAYISFSEDFLFNTFGVEGYVGQRRQIVLTATEFSNVKDVQILIDGKRVDYLGEGIWIGSPVDRSML